MCLFLYQTLLKEEVIHKMLYWLIIWYTFKNKVAMIDLSYIWTELGC